MRLIDADELKKNFQDELCKGIACAECSMQVEGFCRVERWIDIAPTIEAEPTKHGKWIKNDGRSGWHCSCCGKDDLYAYPYTENNERELQDFYCPNCGARMDL